MWEASLSIPATWRQCQVCGEARCDDNKMFTSCRVCGPGSHGPHDAPSTTSSSSLRVRLRNYLVIPGETWHKVHSIQSIFVINCILILSILLLKLKRIEWMQVSVLGFETGTKIISWKCCRHFSVGPALHLYCWRHSFYTFHQGSNKAINQRISS